MTDPGEVRLSTFREQRESRLAVAPSPILVLLGGAVLIATPILAHALGFAPQAPWLPIIIGSSVLGGFIVVLGAVTLPFWLRKRRSTLGDRPPWL